MRRLLHLWIAAILLAASSPAFAASKTPIRFVLDWKYQGIHAFAFWAQQKGYFADEGLDVTIDQGSGSAATVTKIAAGAYDAGFGDINAIIQLASTKPGEQPVMVYMMYSRPPFALITKAGSPIKTFKDVAGRTLGTPAGAAAGQLFVPLATTNGVDPTGVKVLNMAPNLQEQMLLTGQVDVSAVFSVTSYVNLIGLKIDPDKDINWMFYSDLGLDLYSNGIMVSAKLIKDNPKAVAGLVRAINRAVVEIGGQYDAAIAVMLATEPLLNPELEKQRLAYTYKTHIVTPETDEIGLGDVKDDRMSKAIDLIAATYNLPSKPTLKDVFDRSFLPAKDARMLKLAH